MRKAQRWMTLEEWKAKQATDKRTVKGVALRKICSDLQMKAVDGVDRAIKFVISSQTVDRDKDTLSVTGWKLDSFKRNPVVPFAHDYHALPVAKALDIGVEGKTLVSTAQFVSRDIYPFADTVYQMLQGGFLNAVSVGFRPTKHEVNKDRGGIDFLEQELLEYSVVPIPANPEALVEARSLGIDLNPLKEWAEEVLDQFHEEEVDSPMDMDKEFIEELSLALTPEVVAVPEMKAEDPAPTEVTPEASNDPEDIEEVKTAAEIVEAKLDAVGVEPQTPTEAEEPEVVETKTDEQVLPTIRVLDAQGNPLGKTPDVEVKVDPSVLGNPLPESYEWVSQRLAADALGFLTRNGVEARTDGMDMVIPVSTFADTFVFCLIGRDRPFEDDPCFMGSYKRDKRLGGLPRFKGEPTRVDIQVSMDLVESMPNARAFKQGTQAKAVAPVTPEVVEFLDARSPEVQECLGEVLSKAMEQEVRKRVQETVNKLRGVVD